MPPWATRKIAGIPAWGWAVAALGAVALGIYFRRRSIATNNASTSSDPTGLGDLANSLAGGATAGAPSGLDPALADLLNSAMGLMGQGISDAAMGGPGGYYDPGTGFDGSGSGSGQDAPAGTSVAASGAGTTYDPRLDPGLYTPHPAAVTSPSGMLTDPWSGVSWSPGFATLTAADVARATGSGAAPLARSPSPRRPATPSFARAAAAPRRSSLHPLARPPARRPSARKPRARSSSGWSRV